MVIACDRIDTFGVGNAVFDLVDQLVRTIWASAKRQTVPDASLELLFELFAVLLEGGQGSSVHVVHFLSWTEVTLYFLGGTRFEVSLDITRLREGYTILERAIGLRGSPFDEGQAMFD